MARLDQEVPAGSRSHRLRRDSRRPRRARAARRRLSPCGRHRGGSPDDAGALAALAQPAAAARGARTAGGSSRRSSSSSRVSACRRTGRYANCPAAGAAACCSAQALVSRARPAAARRADQPSRHRRDPMARGLPARVPRRAALRHPRSRVPPALATRIVELDRGRLTSWPGDYASYLEKKAARSRTKRASSSSSTRSWRRRKPGCARASRRGGRATRDACAR